jgi:predicted nucleotide-binding protein
MNMSTELEQIQALIKRSEALQAQPAELFPSDALRAEWKEIATIGASLGENVWGIDNPHVQALRQLATRCTKFENNVSGINEWAGVVRDMPIALKPLMQVAFFMAHGYDRKAIEDLDGLVDEVSKLGNAGDSNRAEKLRRDALGLSVKLFGPSNLYAATLEKLPFPAVTSATPPQAVYDTYLRHRHKLLHVLFEMQQAATEAASIASQTSSSTGLALGTWRRHTGQVERREGKDMSSQDAVFEKIQEFRTRLEALKLGRLEEAQQLIAEIAVFIRRTQGNKSPYSAALSSVRFPGRPPLGEYTFYEAQDWEEATANMRVVLNTMERELKEYGTMEHNAPTPVKPHEQSNRVFIVHGRDETMKEAVARVISDLGLKPVILHEQTNQGRTVIEKFEANASDVGYAVVLLSPDDMAYSRSQKPEQARPRARQNVVLELGYFIAKLGREKVTTLYRGIEGLELPSDIAGVVYTQFDDAGHWRYRLADELRAAGYTIDKNKL